MNMGEVAKFSVSLELFQRIHCIGIRIRYRKQYLVIRDVKSVARSIFKWIQQRSIYHSFFVTLWTYSEYCILYHLLARYCVGSRDISSPQRTFVVSKKDRSVVSKNDIPRHGGFAYKSLEGSCLVQFSSRNCHHINIIITTTSPRNRTDQSLFY